MGLSTHLYNRKDILYVGLVRIIFHHRPNDTDQYETGENPGEGGGKKGAEEVGVDPVAQAHKLPGIRLPSIL